MLAGQVQSDARESSGLLVTQQVTRRRDVVDGLGARLQDLLDKLLLLSEIAQPAW